MRLRYSERPDECIKHLCECCQRGPHSENHEKENLDHDAAKEKVEHTDEERAAYYYEHTGKTWGDVNDYHMILDTSELGVENCADILMHYFEKLEYI